MPQRLHRVSTALFPGNLCVDREVLGKWQGDWDLVGLGNRSLSFNVLCCKPLMYKLFILMNSLTNGMQHR